MTVPVLLLAVSGLLAAQPYDLLLKGGHVLDPKNNIDRKMDVAIQGNKIAKVAPAIEAAQAKKVIACDGLYVTPGLVDIHVHVYFSTALQSNLHGDSSSYAGFRAVHPDGFAFRSGVTTVVDVGSSGWRNFPEFKERVIENSKTRVYAMLNIVGSGMAGRQKVEQNLGDMSAEETARVAKQFPEHIVGVKTAHYAGPEWIPVDNAVKAGTSANIPVMVDFGTFRPERPFAELVTKRLRPGDMYTHFFIGAAPLLDPQEKILPFLYEARRRGVKFDVGHGAGSFSWKNAVPVVSQGFLPDSISTDLHQSSMNAGMKDMLNVMSKILNLGVPVYEVIRLSTINPANQIKRPRHGHLTEGAEADVAVLRIDRGRHGFLDSHGARFDGSQLLVGELTVKGGEVVWDLNGRAGQEWKSFYKAHAAK
ncbi:MAG: amidohydrolase/deacetylase family metallohydrolase [Acidobacteria bacterium]|nr:amidohydrolase/deacetylase family metallohydrolase [Acidobacteriota bacterium]